MNINPINGAKVNPYQKQLQNQPSVKQKSNQADQVEISAKAKEMQQGNSLVKARQEHVNEIKQQVQNGEYEVDAKKTAEKLKAFFDHRA
ncbi:flagellar biosynthesis anti-sigma factor FlgM [Alkalibacillus aidingensis]|uniref:flagellar biosynthesis anti-sigma factor FlgM n=1 Tax=Alkalibacillus aidingensis TaxID=2747607 RepID=UPI001661353B|nr:flagellar biosynthesis anti-sigma factor FlgM [Alkalibacillus aidingensis]